MWSTQCHALLRVTGNEHGDAAAAPRIGASIVAQAVLPCRRYLQCIALVATVFLSAPSFAASYTATFSQVSNTTAPNHAEWRGWSVMTWVESLGGLVMWGGSGGRFLNDIQLLDPTTADWMTIYPTTDCPGNSAFAPPNGSDENGVVWDAISDRLWIYNGGSGYRCATVSRVGHTAAAGTTSTQIVDPTLSDVANFYRDWTVRAPNGFKAAVTAYNASTKILTLGAPLNVVAGGSYDLYVDFGGGTWSYDFATGAYSKLQQRHWGYSGYVPVDRKSPGFAGDGTKAFLFGGVSFDNGIYKLDFATRSYSIAIAQGSLASPAARGQIQNQFVYDSANNRYVLFGGRCFDASRCTGVLNDTWLYDPVANRWTQVATEAQPPARNQAFMYYDASKRVVVLYGGTNGTTVFNDLWTFDVDRLTWTQQSMPGVNPGGVYLGQAGYAPTTQCGYIVYGLGPGAISAKGVWELCLTPAGGNVPPTASFTATPTTTITGSPIALSAAGSFDPDGSIVSYAWNFGDGTTGTGASVSKTYSTAGTYTITLTVTDNGGLKASTTRSVTITQAPANQPPTASFTVNPSTTTIGMPISLSATASSDGDGSIVSYAWNFGDGTTGSGVTTTKSYAAAGTYTVKLTVTDNGGLSASASATVTVTSSGGSTIAWIDDALPAGAVAGGNEPFTWVTANPAPFSGTKAHQSKLASGVHQHYFVNANPRFTVGVGDVLFAYVYLDPTNPPRQVELQWFDGSWEHRAYWGASLIAWSATNSPGGRNMGPLPPTGRWVRLEVPAALVALEGRQVSGMAFTLYDGRATWDLGGRVAGSGG